MSKRLFILLIALISTKAYTSPKEMHCIIKAESLSPRIQANINREKDNLAKHVQSYEAMASMMAKREELKEQHHRLEALYKDDLEHWSNVQKACAKAEEGGVLVITFDTEGKSFLISPFSSFIVYV